jgi:hypothetical protein
MNKGVGFLVKKTLKKDPDMEYYIGLCQTIHVWRRPEKK